MKKALLAAAYILITVLVIAGCGEPIIPPSGLTAEGALAGIVLRWTPSTDANLTGYLVERSIEGGPFDGVATVAAGAHIYSDTEVSDGELYTYRVKAIAGTKKSEPTNTAISMHGTRISNQSSTFTTIAGNSPYVIEGAVSFAGSLVVDQNTKLYVMPGATVTFTSPSLQIFSVSSGLLQIRGTVDSPVTVTSSGAGFEFSMVAAASGTLLEYAQFSNLKKSVKDCLVFSACSPTVRYCRFEPKDPGVTFGIYGSSSDPTDVVLEHCYFRDFGVYFQTKISDGLKIDSCIFTGGQPAIMFGNFSSGATAPASNQLVNNVFQLCGTSSGSYYLADLSLMGSGPTGTIPLGGNYFYKGTAYSTAITQASDFFIYPSSATGAFDFSGIRTARPTGAGPGWGVLPF